MTFEKINFENQKLNELAGDIIKKAEELHTSFQDQAELPYLMESGSYLGNKFFNETYPSFLEIKKAVGMLDERMQYLSELIAVTSITLARFNCQHANILASTSDYKKQPQPVLLHLRISVEEAINLIEKVRPLEMSQRARELLNETSNMSLLAQKRVLSRGCYIATCVYQNINAPEVLLLRKYRDEVIEKKHIGKSLHKNVLFYISNYCKLLWSK